MTLKDEYMVSLSPLEKAILRGFRRAFSKDDINLDDDFFTLKGNENIAKNIIKCCGKYDITLSDILNGKSPRNISKIVENRSSLIYSDLPISLDKVKLTDSQMGIYLDCMMNPMSLMYNIPVHITFTKFNNLSDEEIKDKLNSIFKTHKALYSYMEEVDDDVYMVKYDYPIEGLVEIRGEVTLSEFTDKMSSFLKPINLKTGPFIYSYVYRCEGKLHILLNLHHIVSDGTSVRILCDEICEAFSGKEISHEKLDSFNVYEISKRIKESDKKCDGIKYFDNLLNGVEVDSNLLADFKSEEDGINNTKRLDIEFKPQIEGLKNSDISLNTLFVGAFGYTLSKLTGQSESLFTVGESGRHNSIMDNTVIMMVKTLPMYIKIDEEKKGLEFLSEIQNEFYTSLKYDHISFGDLSRNYGIKSDVAFVYQSDMFKDFDFGNVKGSVDILENHDSFANINASVLKEEDRYIFRVEYRKDLYRESTIKRMGELFITIVNSLLKDVPLKDIPLISSSDLELLKKFNDTYLPYDIGRTFSDIFRDTVDKYPDKIAVIFSDKSYTYKEVDELSDSIASYIRSKGIGREDVVSVLIPRSEYMAVLSIGIIKAGAIYEPMDPSYPIERLTLMHKDAKSKLVIADRDLISLLPEYEGDIIFTDEINNLPKVKREDVLKYAPNMEDTYVLLYTSGTTGVPKGCRLSNRNLISFTASHMNTLNIDETSVIALYASYGFDAHMADLYPSMASGATLVIIPDELRLDFPRLKEYMEKVGVTHILMTTQVAKQFILEYKEVKGLKVLSTGGESLSSFEPHNSYKIMNLYGPSEATVCVTGFLVDKYYETIPIGHALFNSHLYVVDTYGRNLPIGAPGELIISGPQVGKGYLNRSEKTKGVFVHNIYEDDYDLDHEMCYKTGDIVRYLEDGNIVFIGRRDQQVKIRGFRIELSEIEEVIRSYPDIKNVAIVVVDNKGEKSINSYIVSDEVIDINKLKEYIRSKKPSYMVPSGIMQIDSIPLTVNQKLDRKKLPPILTMKGTNSGERSLTLIEGTLMNILSEILGENKYDVETSFSDLGISSITSIKFAGRIYREFGLHVTSKEILNGGTILSIENRVIEHLIKDKEDKKEKSRELLKSYPLTKTQMGIYLESLKLGMSTYNIPLMIKLPKDIYIPKLKQAIEVAIRNHPSMLSYIYPDEKGDVAIYPKLDMVIEIVEEEAQDINPKLTCFEFKDKPLFNFRIIMIKDDRYLLMEIHHIISDGESMKILMEDIDKAYRDEKLMPEELTSYELTLMEEAARNGEEMRKAKELYDSIFKGVSQDYTPYGDINNDDCYSVFNYDMKVSHEEVDLICDKYKVTRNILFTAVFSLLLSKYTSHEDALFATIYNGRINPRTERLVSMLVKTLPLYIKVDSSISVGDYLRDVDKRLGDIRLNDIFAFSDAVREYGIGSDVMFIYQGKMMKEVSFDGNLIKPVTLSADSPKVPLSTEVFEYDDSFGLTIEYNGGKYSKEWIESFCESYTIALVNILSHDRLSDVEILSDKALHKYDYINDTDIDVTFRPTYMRLHEFSNSNPSKIALIASPEDEDNFKDKDGNRIYETLTYGELDNMSNELACRILDLGINKDTPIGVMTGRSKEVYIGEFAINKAGCPFVFLSPSYPKDRIDYILSEANIGAVLTTRRIATQKKEVFSSLSIPTIYIDDISRDLRTDCPMIDRGPEDLVYMIYTSGSTGKPKGVMVKEKGLNNLSDLNEKNLQIKYLPQDRMCAVTAFTFDASILDGYVSLVNGKTLIIASDEDIHNPSEFTRLCLDNDVKGYVCTPSFEMSLLDYPKYMEVVKNLEGICLGGEVFSPILFEKLKKINPHINLINGYGPSEATVCATAKLIEDINEIDIGSPIGNTKVYVVDKLNHILPMGALGELVVTGVGVGKGYLNRPDLTNKSFFKLMGEDCYRTGDLALVNERGTISFHGRIDNQVKLRGLRVELGEIESAINSYPGVKESIVIVKNKDTSPYLVAYYTADTKIEGDDLRLEISKALPEYMVPRILIELPKMPITSNGKIDKKALPDTGNIMENREIIAPKSKLEEILLDAFKDALGIEKIGVTDNFFDLGGTSLTATKIAMKAMANNIAITYKDIFKNPTVRGLSELALKDLEVNSEEGFGNDDLTYLNEVTSKNVWDMGSTIDNRPLGNVLITGATGFLGMHVLKSFLDNEEGDVYCLLKKGNFTSIELRLRGLFFYYFEKSLEDLPKNRLHFIEGDITDRDLILSLEDIPFDTVINCAACVKHFVSGDVLEKVNVEGVKNLADLCLKTSRRIIHISTVSVAGESVNGRPDRNTLLKESDFYFNQTLENQYILSKFKSEKIILDGVLKGLDGKIMRAGNLMPRSIDGEFQINSLTNGFMRQLKGYYALGCISYQDLLIDLEFSPIDDTARVILNLSKTDSKYTIFHTNNVHKVFMSDVIKAMNRAGLKIDTVSEEEFNNRLMKTMENSDLSDEVGGLISYLNSDREGERFMLGYDNTFTANILNRIGCSWNITDDNYLTNAFSKLDGLGFFMIKSK